MLVEEEVVEVHILSKQGKSIRAIARELGISRNTVKRYLNTPSLKPIYPPRETKPKKLDPFKDYLGGRIEAAKPDWIPASVLFEEIKCLGYTGEISLLRAYLNPLKPKLDADSERIRFETAPGHQMQVDFTTIKRGRVRLKAFVATLGYSRASYVRFSEHERQADWITGIEESFVYFGGVPKELLFDNAKTIILERDAYAEGKHRWNSKLLECAKAYGFIPRVCRPYRAQTKGKVERFNGYLKHSFIVPLAAQLKQAGLDLDVTLANSYIGAWLANAHQRIHGTTGVPPSIRLQEEQSVLHALPTDLKPVRLDLLPDAIQPIPYESLQHPLNVYDQFLGEIA